MSSRLIEKCEEHELPIACDCSFSCGACGQNAGFDEGQVLARDIDGVIYYEFTHSKCDNAPECADCGAIVTVKLEQYGEGFSLALTCPECGLVQFDTNLDN